VVTQTKTRIRWPLRRILQHLEIPPATYHRWRQRAVARASVRASPGSLYETLPAERQAIVDYALAHSELRHRELAWKMLDENIAAVSPSTVYRLLGEANLVCRWTPRGRRKGAGRAAPPTGPDQRWQTDIRYVKVRARNYYLLAFLDVYSRYIVHHELLRFMDGHRDLAGGGASDDPERSRIVLHRPGVRPDARCHGGGPSPDPPAHADRQRRD